MGTVLLMARPPLIFDTPVGKFYAIDMGGGLCALVIHGDDGAQSYPFDAAMALKLQAWLASGGPKGGPKREPKRSPGRPRGTPTVTNDELQQLVDTYTSEEAAASGAKGRFTSQQLGITETQVYSRLTRAKDRGIYNGQAD